MIKLINPQSDTYHHLAISDFSDTNIPITSGISKGHAINEFSWVAEFLFKNAGNLSINPNIGYISFVSERDMMYQEYGNVERIYSNYSLFSYWQRSILSDHAFELDTKQYFKISQKYAEYDLIEYINATTLNYYTRDDEHEEEINHEFYRAPALWAAGYKLDWSVKEVPEYLDTYIWTKDVDNSLGINTGIPRSKVNQYGAEFYYPIFGEDLVTNDGKTIFDDYVDNYNDPSRIITNQFNVDNKWFYFKNQEEWVIYPYNSIHYQVQEYKPYYGIVKIYNELFEELSPIPYENTDDSCDSSIMFFPEVIIKGRLEPAKYIVSDLLGKFSPDHGNTGYSAIHTGVHLGERDDQSRVVYNICNRMISLDEDDRFKVERRAPDDQLVCAGIDVETEKNRRYSAVVMTEPYMVVEPMGAGTLVEYSFVDRNGAPIAFYEEQAFINNPDIFLKIKAPLSLFTELNKNLSTIDINTDIISVLTMVDPIGNIASLSDDGAYYELFGLDPESFFRRQDDCLDDLLNGVIGTGVHSELYIDAFGADADKYSDAKMKVCGIGFHSKTITEGGVITGTKNYLNFYCTNYTAKNSPDKTNNNDEPLPNIVKKIVTDTDDVSLYSHGEQFKPMIKLPGMNGYIKIMEKNTHFKSSRAKDGDYEFVYNVEFPYCPGSYYSRTEMNFSENPNLSGFIYKKTSYINAGPHEVVDGKYDIGTNRYSPFGDDSFVAAEIFAQQAQTGFVQTDPEKYGGKRLTLSSLNKDRINYPADLVWSKLYSWKLLQLVKSQLDNYRRYGTFNITLSETPVEGGAAVPEGSDEVLQGTAKTEVFGSNVVDKWITVIVDISETEVAVKTNSSTENPNQNIFIAHSREDISIVKPIEAIDLRFRDDPIIHPTYIGSLEILHGGNSVSYTDFNSGMNGWLKTVGDGLISIVNSPDGTSSKSLLYNGDGILFLRKTFKKLNLSEGNFQLVLKIWYPTPSVAMDNDWTFANTLTIDSLVFNGLCSRVVFKPATEPEYEDIYNYTIETPIESYVPQFSRDIKLFCLVDNQQWKFSEDKYSSFIGRENPSYVCEMDVSTLFEDYTQYQAAHGAIPDAKRWICGYFSGFAHMMALPALPEPPALATEKISTIRGNVDIASKNVDSHIIVEIWDSQADVGNGQIGNWRPFMSIGSDFDKIPGDLILDNIYIGDETAFGEDDLTLEFTNSMTGTKIYSLYIGYKNLYGFDFPPEIHYGDGGDIINGLSDVVLYDTINKKSFHIAYMKAVPNLVPEDNSKQLYKTYIKYDPATDGALEFYNSAEDLEVPAIYELRYPFRTLTKDSRFYSRTLKAINGSDSGFITRYLDIRSQEISPSDYERFIVNNKVNFRIRVVTGKNNLGDNYAFPVSYIDKDNSEMTYVGPKIDTECNEWVNYPWSEDEGVSFDEGFDWAKIKTKEMVRKLGLSYFKCESK